MIKIPQNRKLKQEPLHSGVSFFLGNLAIIIMLVLYAIYIQSNIEYDQKWAKFALLQGGFGLIGLYITLLIRDGTLYPQKKRKTDLNTGIQAMIVFVAMMLAQTIAQFTMAIENYHRALYYVFAAVCEELFFRLFIIEALKKIGGDNQIIKLISIPLSAIIFTLIHVNYYDNPAMLLGVFLGGVVLAIAYIVWENITVNILAHFALNMYAVGSWLATLSIQTTNIQIIIIFIWCFCAWYIWIYCKIAENAQEESDLAKLKTYKRLKISLLIAIAIMMGIMLYHFGQFIILPAEPGGTG